MKKIKFKKIKFKKILLFIALVIFFIFLIFLIKNYFFWWLNNHQKKIIEESYIDNSIIEEKILIWNWNIYVKNWTWNLDPDLNNIKKNNLISEKIIEHFNSASKLNYYYIPEDFSDDIKDYSSLLSTFFDSNYIYNKLDNLNVEFYEELFDIRGKMKNMTLKLYWVLKMRKEEFISVAIHEFAHYIDIYFLEKKVFKDLSSYFYEISWSETKILKPWQKQIDFVSGYAMTNKYEDFAESFTYYVLHNNDFLEKSKKSLLLKKKYDFFKKSVFRNDEFSEINFSGRGKIQKYYRDITKIDVNLEFFLQYLKKWLQ